MYPSAAIFTRQEALQIIAIDQLQPCRRGIRNCWIFKYPRSERRCGHQYAFRCTRVTVDSAKQG